MIFSFLIKRRKMSRDYTEHLKAQLREALMAHATSYISINDLRASGQDIMFDITSDDRVILNPNGACKCPNGLWSYYILRYLQYAGVVFGSPAQYKVPINAGQFALYSSAGSALQELTAGESDLRDTIAYYDALLNWRTGDEVPRILCGMPNAIMQAHNVIREFQELKK